MERSKIAVLKFGGSVLINDESCMRVIHEVYRYFRKGYRVLAVVSALENETDRLIEEAAAITGPRESSFLPFLLATGEEKTATLLAMGLERVGLKTQLAHPYSLSLKVNGPGLDAKPTGVNLGHLQNLLGANDVVVVPGFVGIDEANNLAVMGRGGTDLTALFLAQRLQASVCRLIKDVDGVFESDPNLSKKRLKRYNTIHWDEVQSVAKVLVQPKATLFSKEQRFEFEVAGFGKKQATTVGPYPSDLQVYSPSPPLRVGLLGLGNVGGGIYRHLTSLTDLFSIEKVVVKHAGKKRDITVPKDIFSTQTETLFDQPLDLLIECIGGTEPATFLIETALELGIDVVTANKEILAKSGDRLEELTFKTGARLFSSAAVGGGAPILEGVKTLTENNGIKQVDAVLNGTCNFILDKVAAGKSFDQALKQAQDLGFAEADPSLDIEGWDAAFKIQIISYLAFGVFLDVRKIPVEGITSLEEEQIRAVVKNGKAYRLIASCKLENGEVKARVRPEIIPSHYFLAGARNETCRAILTPEMGDPVYLSGKGAGCWPTSEAVIADVLDIYRLRSDQEIIKNVPEYPPKGAGSYLRN
ncbi:MAG: homoserine dehydrogenase [Sphingomonadales bacterium]